MHLGSMGELNYLGCGVRDVTANVITIVSILILNDIIAMVILINAMRYPEGSSTDYCGTTKNRRKRMLIVAKRSSPSISIK